MNLLLAANWEQVTSIGGLQRRQWLIIPMDSAAAIQANSKILASPKLEPGDLFQGQRITFPTPAPAVAAPHKSSQNEADAKSSSSNETKKTKSVPQMLPFKFSKAAWAFGKGGGAASFHVNGWVNFWRETGEFTIHMNLANPVLGQSAPVMLEEPRLDYLAVIEVWDERRFIGKPIWEFDKTLSISNKDTRLIKTNPYHLLNKGVYYIHINAEILLNGEPIKLNVKVKGKNIVKLDY